MPQYTIRQFTERDTGRFLSLYESVFETSMSSEVFNWKYINNPYVDSPPIFVAEEDSSGEIVGARPHFALELEKGSWTGIALQPCDTMVHEDHRKRGLFQQMTLTAVEHYRNGEPFVMFNFPNNNSRPGYMKMGWKVVGGVGMQFRFNNPQAAVKKMVSPRAGAVMKLANLPAKTLLSVLDGAPLKTEQEFLGSHRYPSELEIEITCQGPPSKFAERAPSDESLHLYRDKRYFDWRFEKPTYGYIFHTAKQEGYPIATLVTQKESFEEATVLSIVDAVSLLPSGTSGTSIAWAPLLQTVIQENGDADVIRMFSGTIPDRIALRFGFLADTSFPLSLISSPTKLVALPLYSAEDEISRTDLFSMNNWNLPLSAWDVT